MNHMRMTVGYHPAVFEKTCAITQKNVKLKGHVFLILKKTFKKRTYSFTGHLITQPLITQLPAVSTGKSPTSNILLRIADTIETMQLRWLRMDHTPGAGN